MEKGKRNLLMEIFLKGYIKMVDLMGMEDIIGRVRMLFMKEGLRMGLGMGKGNGNRDRLYMKVIILKD